MKKIGLIIFLLGLFSCTTSIDSLKRNPEKYSGQIVSVKGSVSKRVDIPFTDYAFFELEDKTGNILVFTLTPHKNGDIVKFRGEVVAFDSTENLETAVDFIQSIEGFISENIKLDEDKLHKTSESIAKSLIKILKSLNVTYMLMEQGK